MTEKFSPLSSNKKRKNSKRKMKKRYYLLRGKLTSLFSFSDNFVLNKQHILEIVNVVIQSVIDLFLNC